MRERVALIRTGGALELAHRLTLEEAGLLMAVFDLCFVVDCPIPAAERSLARACGCDVRVARRVRDSLLAKGFLSPMALGEIAPSPWFLDRLLWRPRRLGLSPAVRAFVLKRDGYACVYCQADDRPLHVDHVIPVTAGGTDEIENLATACQPCNLSKGAKMLADWRPDLAGRPQ